MKNILLLIFGCLSVYGAYAEQRVSVIASDNIIPYRTEFISYGARELAEQRDNANNAYYVPLTLEAGADDKYSCDIDIPYMWLDRDVFIHIQGAPSFYLDINDKQVGYGQDSRTQTEFNISQYVLEGSNKISINAFSGAGSLLEPQSKTMPTAYILSQPKLRIEDYIVTAPLDSTGNYANFEIKVAVSNSYNFEENITIGYDLYTPEGTLKEYSIADAVIPGQGRDTVVFKEKIYGAKERLWSAETPKMYYGILYVRRDGRMIEYVPYRIGFGETLFVDGNVYRNGRPINIKAVRYNSENGPKETLAQLTKLKKDGYNTVCPDYPQATWFYDECENVGMYVIDQANINPNHESSNLRLGGTYNNSPELLDAYLERMKAMYGRNKNRTCIIGWSLGGNGGNGYNMYKSYQLLKSIDVNRAVVFRGAEGEWNSDFDITFDK